MKLLFDQNLSPRLVGRLADLYPNSIHVSSIGLDRASDAEIRAYARDHGYTMVSKDVDFSELGVVHGFPPKVIWIRLGNCTTAQIEELLREYAEAVGALHESDKVGLLTLFHS